MNGWILICAKSKREVRLRSFISWIKGKCSKEKSISFWTRGSVSWEIKVGCVYQWLIEPKRGSWRGLLISEISFIRLPPRYTVTWEKSIGGIVLKKYVHNFSNSEKFHIKVLIHFLVFMYKLECSFAFARRSLN